MANQTISVNRNSDDAAIAGLANGEDYTVNSGAVLTINSDNRWSQQAAVIGNIAIDAGTGGTVRIDGRDVWWVAFDASTGNVPALGTAGVLDSTGGTSGAQGEFLGVWTALGVAPSAAASAMPATGFVKFRRKTGTFVDNETITLPGGATVVVNSATGGQRGWLHIVGEEGSTITVPRLGLFEALGDWFDLGTTSGAGDQTIQYPVADICPMLQIETSPGSGVYETWVCAGTTRWGQAANRVAQDARGKLFGCTTAGVITLARRATNACGQLPAAGCKIRCPNVHVSNAVTSTWVTPANSATLGTRWDFTTSSAGALVFDKVNGNWFISLAQAYSATLTDCGTTEQVNLSEIATKPVLTRCGVGLTAAIDAAPLSIASCFAGVEIVGGQFVKYENESNDTGANINEVDALVITGARFGTFADNTAATLDAGASGTSALQLTRCNNSTLTSVEIQGGLRLVTCASVTVTGTIYANSIEGKATNTVSPISGIEVLGGCSRVIVDGFSYLGGIANIHPYSFLVNLTAAFDCEVRNIGTAASPINLGSANACAGIAGCAGNGARNVVRRCYADNARTGGIVDTNADSRCSYINVWGDGADTGFVINGLNVTARGLRGTNPATGATAVYGSHFYDTFVSTTEARLVLLGNEPTALSGSKLQTTGGVARYTSTGQVQLRAVGDEVTWEMDYFWLGITALNNAAPTFSGTNSANHVIEFQWDTGSGWNGSWVTASGANLAAVGAITPATGIKLKVRARCTVAAATNAIINIRITATTNATDQQIQYPLPGTVLTITGIQSGSDVVILAAGTATIRAQADAIVGSSYAYEYTGTESVDIGIIKTGFVPLYIRNYSLAASNASLPVAQQVDRNYAA